MAELVGKLVVKNKAIFSILERVAALMGCWGAQSGGKGPNGGGKFGLKADSGRCGLTGTWENISRARGWVQDIGNLRAYTKPGVTLS